VTERAAIARFLAGKRIALVGVSSRTEDFSRALFRELVARGYDVVPVHPGFVVAGAILHSAAMFGSLLSTWIPFLLIFMATLLVGGWMRRSASRPPG
jgi:hypothetical protein